MTVKCLMKTRDTLANKRIRNVDTSPDGKRAVFTVALAEMANENSDYLLQINLADSNDCHTRQLNTSGLSS